MMPNLLHKVLVADDELPSRQFVCELIKQDPRFQISAVCDSGSSTVAEARGLELDALFLDIQMPGMDGFEVMDAIRENSPLVVLVTAFGDYAVRAFEKEAFDYIKKPIDPARFSQVLERIHRRLLERAVSSGGEPRSSDEMPETEKGSSSASKIPQGKKLLNAVRQDLVYEEKEVQLVESAGNYVNVRINGEPYLVRESLENFCRNLDSTDFVRVHRSFVVNVRWVRKMHYGKSGSAELYLADGHKVPVSRSRRKQVTGILRRLSGSSEIQDDDFVI